MLFSFVRVLSVIIWKASLNNININLADTKTSTYNVEKQIQTIPDSSQKQTSVSKHPNSK